LTRITESGHFRYTENYEFIEKYPGIYAVNFSEIPRNSRTNILRKYKFFANTSYPSCVLVWLHKYCHVKFDLICGVWGNVQDIDFNLEFDVDGVVDKHMLKKVNGASIYATYAGWCDRYSEHDTYEVNTNCTGNFGGVIKKYFDKVYFSSDGKLSVDVPKNSIKIYSHITSFIVGYQMMRIVEKINDIGAGVVATYCDAIFVRNGVDNFELGTFTKKEGVWCGN
jgi:hypothetical protein